MVETILKEGGDKGHKASHEKVLLLQQRKSMETTGDKQNRNCGSHMRKECDGHMEYDNYDRNWVKAIEKRGPGKGVVVAAPWRVIGKLESTQVGKRGLGDKLLHGE